MALFSVVFNVRKALYYATGVDLTAIEGIDELHALTLMRSVASPFFSPFSFLNKNHGCLRIAIVQVKGL
jgi:hypothetical protein